MITLDGNGIAAIIAGGVAGIVSIGTFAMQVMNWRDSRKRDSQIKEVKELVNGKSEQLAALMKKAAFEEGRKHQIETPSEPSPDVIAIPDKP